ncbi:hypothetical protein V1527DRAFT_478749 [Lipomyces starkeyi]
MVDEAVRVMRNAAVSDHVISRIQTAGHLRSSTHSRRKSHKEPDGLIIFDEVECINAHRIAFDLGCVSQAYSNLRQATLWWIEQKKATVRCCCV